MSTGSCTQSPGRTDQLSYLHYLPVLSSQKPIYCIHYIYSCFPDLFDYWPTTAFSNQQQHKSIFKNALIYSSSSRSSSNSSSKTFCQFLSQNLKSLCQIFPVIYFFFSYRYRKTTEFFRLLCIHEPARNFNNNQLGSPMPPQSKI